MGLKSTQSSEKSHDREPERDAPWERRGTEASTKIGASVGVVAAVVLAVLVNVLAARHYHRWDLSRGGQFTLSQASIDTLQGLAQPVRLIVLLSKDAPLGVSVDELLTSYRAQTGQLEIENIDPDRDQARLVEVQKKYGLVAGERGGRIVTDAVLIAVAGDRHHYVRADELVTYDDADSTRATPRLEQAVTGALRSVLSSERPVACFTEGHSEPSLDVGGEGFAELRERLSKNNLDARSVFGPADAASSDPLAGCDLLVVATPRAPVPAKDVEAMKRFVERGGDALVVAGPIPNEARTDWVDLGLGELVALAGVTLERDYVFEGDRALRPSRGYGEAFFPTSRPHPATARLRREEEMGLAALVAFSSSLRDAGSSLKPEVLLEASPKSFGVVDYWRRDVPDSELAPSERDRRGPLTIAVATERPPSPGQKRGARVVVVSSSTALMGANWRSAELAGTALFIEGAIAWLTERDTFLDIPNRPPITVSLRLTEDAMSTTFWSVVVALPSLVAAIGVAIFVRRRRRPSNVLPSKKAEKARDRSNDEPRDDGADR
jgi:hypothetical protein